jgi:hypothetical protein
LEDDTAIRSWPGDRAAAQTQAARARPQEAADQVQQSALAAAARPNDGDELVFADVEINVSQRVHGLRAVAIPHFDGAHLQARN